MGDTEDLSVEQEEECVCVKAIHPTPDFIGRGFLAELYN